MISIKSQGKVEVVDFKPKPSVNSIGVYADIICKDEAGTLFMFPAAYFTGELRYYNPDQGMAMGDYCQARERFFETEKGKQARSLWWYSETHIAHQYAYILGLKYDDPQFFDPKVLEPKVEALLASRKAGAQEKSNA